MSNEQLQGGYWIDLSVNYRYRYIANQKKWCSEGKSNSVDANNLILATVRKFMSELIWSRTLRRE